MTTSSKEENILFSFLSQSRAAGLIKQLTDAGEQLEQTRLELETFNQLKVDFCVKV